MNDNNNRKHDLDGAWIGIDLGTTNCAVAVYDRIRGGSKWIRLPLIGMNEPSIRDDHSNKMGRIVPSIIILATKQYIMDHHHQQRTHVVPITDDDKTKSFKTIPNMWDHWEDVTELMKNTISVTND
jgi:hypothetical protein